MSIPTDIKPRPDAALSLDILRRMSPERRLLKAFELGEMANEVFLAGVMRRHPELTPEAARRKGVEELLAWRRGTS
jgi:hypothetical protein